MPRNFNCPLTEEACEDGRCKAGHCAADFDVSAKEHAQEQAWPIPEGTELHVAAKKYATEILKQIKRPVTEMNLKKLMRVSAVVEEAKRRIEWVKTHPINLDDIIRD